MWSCTHLHKKHVRDVQFPHFMLVTEFHRLSEYLRDKKQESNNLPLFVSAGSD